MIEETQKEIVSPLGVPASTILGYRANGKPIYNIAGGSGEVSVEVAETDTDDDTDDVDNTTTPDADEWTPPSREDYDKLIAAKQKADSEAAARKRYLRDNGLDPKTGKPIEKPSVELDDEDDDDSDEGAPKAPTFDKEKLEKKFNRTLEREVAKAERTARANAYSLVYEVPAALEEAGWNGKNLPRMLKLLDLDEVEIDSDGVDAEALASQVAQAKKDFPEFFKRTRMKDAAKDVADAEAVGGGKKKAPASEEDQDWVTRMKNQLYGG